MRTSCWLAGALLAVGLAAPVSAQTLSFGGPVPSIQNRPIVPVLPVWHTLFSLEDPNLPIARTQLTNAGRSYSLSSYLPRLAPRNNRPVIGQSFFPTPSQLPGIDYFRPFRLRRPGPITH